MSRKSRGGRGGPRATVTTLIVADSRRALKSRSPDVSDALSEENLQLYDPCPPPHRECTKLLNYKKCFFSKEKRFLVPPLQTKVDQH